MSLFSGENAALGPTASVDGNVLPKVLVMSFPLVATTVSESIWIADAAYQLVSAQEVHRVASTSGTLMIEKLTGTTAPGSGTAQLSGTMTLAGTANTNVTGALVTTIPTLQFAAGDRMGAKIAGTMTNLAGGVLTITLKRI